MPIQDFKAEIDALLGNNPTDVTGIQTLLDSATNTITQVKKDNAKVRAVANNEVNNFTNISAELEKQLEQQRKNKDKAAAINKNIQVEAGEANKNPVNTFNNRVASQEATENREKISNEYLEAQREYQEALAVTNNSNFLMKAIRTETLLKPAQQRLAVAQQGIVTNQGITKAATQNLFESMKANIAIAGNQSATELAQSEYDQQITANMITELNEKKKLTASDIAVYSQQLQINESALSTALKEISIAKEKRLLSGAAVGDIMARAQLSTFLEQQDKVAGNTKAQRAFIENEEKLYAQYLTQSNREDEIGTNTYEARFVLNRPDMADPDVTGFYSFKKRNVSNATGYIDAVFKQQTGAPLSQQENMEITMGEKLAQQWNAQIDKEISKIDVDDPVRAQAAKEALTSKKLDPRKEDDQVQISRLVTDFKRESETDATDAISIGMLQIPDMKSALTDPTMTDFQAMIPEDVKELMLSDPFKTVDLSISPGDPAGSVNSTMDQIINAVDLIALGQKNDVNETQSALINKMSRGLADYYKAVRKTSVNNLGFGNVQNLTIQGVNSKVSTGWLSGIDSTISINLENAGEIKTLMLNSIRSRKAKLNKSLVGAGL